MLIAILPLSATLHSQFNTYSPLETQKQYFVSGVIVAVVAAISNPVRR
jgi:hypothetical protein